jgi:nucleotide-binding universal stress UspA family protein
MWPIRTILHPTDFSACSRHAFQLAYSLAHDHGGHIIVLHVTTIPDLPYKGYGGPGLPLMAEEYLQDVRQELEKVQSPNPEVAIERRLAEGDPASEIIRIAAETATDLIVMGTHGRTGLPHVLMGRVAEEVVRKAPCAVLVLKNLSSAEQS